MEYSSQKNKDVSVSVNGLQMLGKMFQWVRHQATYEDEIRREWMMQLSKNVVFQHAYTHAHM